LTFVSAAYLAGIPAVAKQPNAAKSSQSQPSQVGLHGITNADPIQNRPANAWGLSVNEWLRYQQLMKGPMGVFTPMLDPLTALGIEAKSEEERRRYAELQVRVEERRAAKTLAYQRAYDDAWKRLKPGAKIVDLKDAARPTRDEPAVHGADRMAVFVKTQCERCEAQIKRLQSADTGFDIYLVGSHQDDARLRQWAAQVGIEPDKVRNHLITLNHDGGRWLSLGGKGELPAVLKQVKGRWLRQ
jgi:integrating conjugative element protein (TIGR03759 family)